MRLNSKRILTAICIVCLMLIDLKAGNDSWYIWIITNNFVGIAISLIMFSAYPIKEFTRPFYIIWSVLGFFSVIGGYAFWYTHQVGHTMGFWITVPLNIWILGLHFCKYIEKIFITKEIKIRFAKWEYVFVTCMILMLLSKSEFIWPLYFMIIFLMLWHLPFSHDDKREVFMGVLDGIIAGFILLQTYGFTHRSFVNVRYPGAYWNSNRNGALYLFAFTAFLARMLMFSRERNRIVGLEDTDNKTLKKIRFRILLDQIMAAVMAAFTMYTGSRSALVGMAVIYVVYIFVGERRMVHEKWSRIAVRIILFGLVWAVSLPALYFPICYMPMIYSSVKQEVKSIVKGNGIVPISISNDSFVQLDEALDNMVLRFFKSDVEEMQLSEETFSEEMDNSGTAIDATETDIFDETDADQEVADEDLPYVFDIEKYDTREDCYVMEYYFRDYPERGMKVLYIPKKLYGGIISINIRINIYSALISNMNLLGHDSSEMHIVLVSTAPSESMTWIENEQNFIIHYLYAYGIPIGLMFCLFIIAELIYLVYLAYKGKIEAFVFAMIVLVYICIGMMEIVWIPGQVEFVLLFFAPLFFGRNLFGTSKENMDIDRVK